MATLSLQKMTTDRLILELTNVGDASFLLELLNTPKWLKYIGDRNVRTIREAEKYIQDRMFPQSQKLGYGNYTVYLKEDHTPIGSCGLYDRAGLEGLDIGFSFLPQYEGKGYAYESSTKLKQVAIHKIGIKKLSGLTTIDNIASQRLLTKLGLAFIKNIHIPNDDSELMLYQWKLE